MKSSSKLAYFRSMTLLGCFLAMMQQYVSSYWGNLRVYTDSYLRASLGPDSGFQTPWTISCSMIGGPLGMTLFDMFRKYLGIHGTPLLACLAYSFTLGISFYTIGQSVVLFEVILGWATGCSFGMIYSHVLWVVREWCSSQYIGFYSALVTSGDGLGPLVIIQLITWYINPDNKIPDLCTGNSVFFTQNEILNRVPSVFLVLCGFALPLHLLSILLIRDVKHVRFLQEKFAMGETDELSSEEQTREPNSYFHDNTKLTVLPQNGNSYSYQNSCQNKPEAITGTDSIISGCPSSIRLHNHATCGTNESKLLQERQLIYGTQLITCETIDSTDGAGTSDDKAIDRHCKLKSNQTDKDEYMNKSGLGNDEMSIISVRHNDLKKTQAMSDSSDSMRDANSGESPADDDIERQGYQTGNTSSENSDRGTGDLSPLQVLKTPMFYIICLCANCTDLSYILINNYYKAYGQLHIKDDHFLTDVGTTIMIGYLLTRPVWGLMIDYIGLKNTLIFFTSGLALGLAFWSFTLLVNQWLFLIWTVMVSSLSGGFYFVFAMSSLKLFGRKYYITNTGLILASALPLNLICPHIIGLILRHRGYSTLFLLNSCLFTVTLILIVLVIPRKEVD